MDPLTTEQAHETLRRGLESLPLTTHSVVLGALVAGVLMWLFGRHILRLGFVLVGMALGGLAASLLIPGIAPSVPLVVDIIVGAAAGAVLSFVAFRAAVASWFAAIGAVLALSIAALVIGFTMPELPAGQRLHDALLPDDASMSVEDRLDALGVTVDALADAGDDASPRERVRAFGRQLVDDARHAWDEIPSDQRMTLLSSALVGFAAGGLIGFFAPKRSAAALTACVGAGVMVASGLWLAAAGGLEPPRLPLAAWALVWIVLSVVGMRVQFMGARRRADND